jgi:hypothetical protein
MEKELKRGGSTAVSLPLEEERLYNEINLLRLEGYYFCFDKRATAERLGTRKILEQIKLPKGSSERPIVIEANPAYGYPSTVAYKVYQAILKKISDYGRPVPETVSFSRRELARLFGFKSFGGFQWNRLYTAIQQLRHTDIACTLYDKEGADWVHLRFNLINGILMSGSKGRLTQVSIRLEPFISKSLNNLYSLCLNYSRIEKLEPISIALYKHLFYHFSNVHSQTRSRHFTYNKDYADLCHQWLGGLTILKYKSKILSEQLGPHLKALKDCSLISTFEIDKKANGNGGFTLLFSPGKSFFRDYERFYGQQLPLQFEKLNDERLIQEPLELVDYFYQKLYQTNDLSDFLFSDKETDFAASLLKKHRFEEACWFVDFGLREAKGTDFDVKTMMGLRQYHPAFLVHLKQLEDQRELEKKRAEEGIRRQLEDRYRVFWNGKITELRAQLSSETLSSLEAQARREVIVKHPTALGQNILVRVHTNTLLGKQYQLPSFEEWRASQ